MLTETDVLRVFPGIRDIRDARLRKLSTDVWRYVSERNPASSDIERIPLHPAMPIGDGLDRFLLPLLGTPGAPTRTTSPRALG